MGDTHLRTMDGRYPPENSGICRVTHLRTMVGRRIYHLRTMVGRRIYHHGTGLGEGYPPWYRVRRGIPILVYIPGYTHHTTRVYPPWCTPSFPGGIYASLSPPCGVHTQHMHLSRPRMEHGNNTFNTGVEERRPLWVRKRPLPS